MSRYVCQVCGFVYDEAKGMPDKGIAPGTTWDQLPDNWVCPMCGASKSQFKKEGASETGGLEQTVSSAVEAAGGEQADQLREMSNGEIAALLSSLARGCEKQYMAAEAELFTKLAEYYTARVDLPEDADFSKIQQEINQDLESIYPSANAVANARADRGAKRVLTWTEKATRMMSSVLERYESEGNGMIENTKVWVCDVCGFMFIGDVPPAVCPVCKVPSLKILEVSRQ